MSRRVSYSLLDPVLTLPLKNQYNRLHLPAKLPPEAIVVTGHLCAILGAIGFAFSTTYWWAAAVAAFGVAMNHVCDVFDGTHARETGQCRNGGDLLDHFLDPLSFSYWLTGLCVSLGRWDFAVIAVIGLYATAVLTNIKAKLLGDFTLARFGPTEFKTLLVVYGLALAGMQWIPSALPLVPTVAWWFVVTLIGVGVLQLVIQLVRSVVEVNRHGQAPDTSEWVSGNDAA